MAASRASSRVNLGFAALILIRRMLDMSPARYLVVGGGCAALNWALMLLIDRDRYLLSSVLLFVPIGTLGFLLHAFWTFREEPSLRSWIAYLVGMLPGGAVSLAILAALRDGVGLPLALALPATVAIMTIANYLVSWCAIKGLAARRPEHARMASLVKRVGRIARGVYRQLKPHVRGRRIARDEDFSLAVPFGYDLSQAPAPPSTLAVVCHLFYEDLAGEMRAAVASIPYPIDVFLSTDTEEKRQIIEAAFADWRRGRLDIRVLANRGRDIGPKLVGFRDVFNTHDIVLLLHGKKTPDFDKGDLWRRTLMATLAGSPEKVRSILEIFWLQADVGMVICQHFEPIRRFVGWHHNFGTARGLAARMGVTLEPRGPIDMPSGSMFWTRSAAIRPLLDLGLTIEDFPIERGQTNGTLMHAIERLFLFSCEAAGYRWIKVADRGLFDHEETIVTASRAEEVRAFAATKAGRLLPHRRASRAASDPR